MLDHANIDHLPGYRKISGSPASGCGQVQNTNKTTPMGQEGVLFPRYWPSITHNVILCNTIGNQARLDLHCVFFYLLGIFAQFLSPPIYSAYPVCEIFSFSSFKQLLGSCSPINLSVSTYQAPLAVSRQQAGLSTGIRVPGVTLLIFSNVCSSTVRFLWVRPPFFLSRGPCAEETAHASTHWFCLPRPGRQ